MEPRGALGVYDPGEDRYTLYADVQYPHRVRTRPGQQHLQDPRAPDPRHRRRRRRRLRHQGLAVPRAPPGAVGGAKAAAAGEVGVRAQRGDPRRRARPRQRQRGRAGARRRRALPRAPREDARQRRRVRLLRPESARDVQQRDHAGRRLHVPGRPRRGHERADQHQLDGALPRRRPAGGDLRHRAADRRRRARARARSDRAAAEEPDPGVGHAVPDAARHDLRLRRLREEHGRWRCKLADVAGFPARRDDVQGARHAARPRASSTPSSGRPAPSRSSPRSASLRAAARRSSWAPRTRGRATRRRSSRSCTSGSASTRATSATSTATPTASPSAWAPWARARRSSAAPRSGPRPTR